MPLPAPLTITLRGAQPAALLRLLPMLLLSVSAVGSGPAVASPPPGHPSAERAMEMLGVPAGGETDRHGRVVQAIDSNAFTYLELVDEAGDRRWLATPKGVYPLGSLVAYGAGRSVTHFYSRRLQRTFPEVLFVDRVVPLAGKM